jgi:hypothetical protein
MQNLNQPLPVRYLPTWRNSLELGWHFMKKYFLPLFLVILVLVIIDIPLESAQKYSKQEDFQLPLWQQVLGLAYWLLFIPVINYSADMLFVESVRDVRIDVKNIIAGFRNYLNIVLANLLVIALTGIAVVALIIPGIIVACRLAFVSYLVMDKGYDPITAVETSWKLTRGHGWTIFFLGLTSIFIFIGGLILVIVGIFPALIWIKASFASLYQSVLEETDEDFFLQIEAQMNN